MGVDCKSTGTAYAGSNPARPICKNLDAALASRFLFEKRLGKEGFLRPCSSAVEHTLGKGEVMSSILITGF